MPPQSIIVFIILNSVVSHKLNMKNLKRHSNQQKASDQIELPYSISFLMPFSNKISADQLSFSFTLVVSANVP